MMWWRGWSGAMSHKPVARQLLAGPGFPAPAGPGVEQPGRVSTATRPIANPQARPILLSLRQIPRSLFSLEALVLLYMFAPMFKYDPRFAWMPVDATALLFALSVLIGSFIIVLKPTPKWGWVIVWAMLALVVWWIVTLTWSPSQIYGPEKVFYLATLAFWGLIVGALIIGPDPDRVRRLFTLLLLFATWVGIECLLIYRVDPALIYRADPTQAYLPAGADEYRAFNNYQQIASVAGLGTLVAFATWLFGRRTSVANLLFLVLCAMLTFVLLTTGGKGATLATVACMFLALLVGLRVTRRKILYKGYQVSIIWLAVGLMAGISIVVGTAERTPRSLERLFDMVEGGEFQGTAELRYELYQKVLGFVPDAPLLGNGAGSWPVISTGFDRHHTPHNMVLEILVETGIVGLVLMMALLVVAMRPVSLDRLRNDPLVLCAFMLFVWLFIKAQLGPDIADNRLMFMMLGVLTGLMGRRSAASPAAPAVAALRTAPELASFNSRRSSIGQGRLGP
jgi:O-antigen ligase